MFFVRKDAAVASVSETDNEVDLTRAINLLSKDKNLDKPIVVDALETAIMQAARRELGQTADLEARFNEDTNEVDLFQFRTVVENINDSTVEVTLPEARKLDPSVEFGDALGVKIDTSSLGRIAAQTARQIIAQKVRDAEREQIYEEFKHRVGEIMSGYVRRVEKVDLIIDIGRTDAVLPRREQIPTERYQQKDRISGYVLEVRRAVRGPQVLLSRAHPGYLVQLFEQHVPEIHDGIVTIEGAARDPGFRAKIAVFSRDSSVDPVGACIGMKGARVQAVVQELGGERIDIVVWDRDPARYVCNALSPASVRKVLVDEERHTMEIIVPDDQLSLAIGKRGQNVRLAAQLTGWRLDIKSESKLQQELVGAKVAVASIPGIGPMRAEILVNEGINSPAQVAELSPRILQRLVNMEEADAELVIQEAARLAQASIPDHEVFAAGKPRDEAALMSAPPELATPEFAEEATRQEKVRLFLSLTGVGEATAQALADAGYGRIGDIVADSTEEVAQKTGLSLGMAKTVQIAADKYLQAELEAEETL